MASAFMCTFSLCIVVFFSFVSCAIFVVGGSVESQDVEPLDLVDRNSFLARFKALDSARRGIQQSQEYDFDGCVRSLEESFLLHPISMTAAYIGKCFELALIEIDAGAGDIDPVAGIEPLDNESLRDTYLRYTQRWYQKAYDLDRNNPFVLFTVASNQVVSKQFIQAIETFRASLDADPTNLKAWREYGMSLQAVGSYDLAYDAYDICIQLEKSQPSCRLNMATLLHVAGNVPLALDTYEQLIASCRQTSNIGEAASIYDSVSASHDATTSVLKVLMCSEYRKANANLAAGYFQMGFVGLAIKATKGFMADLDYLITAFDCDRYHDTESHQLTQQSSQPVMVSTKEQIFIHGHKPRNREWCSASSYGHCLDIADVSMAGCSRRDFRAFTLEAECSDLIKEKIGSLITLTKVYRMSVIWNRWVSNRLCSVLPKCHVPLSLTQEELHEETNRRVLQLICLDPSAYSGPLLPFDLLLLPVHHSFKLALSGSHSSHIRAPQTTHHDFSDRLARLLHTRKLRYGFISYDINNHPTAHLLEAIFRIIVESRSSAGSEDNTDGKGLCKNCILQNVELILFSYGYDDDSVFRRRLRQVG
jgi:tetratricopeptide (TPR) repeat protein